MSFAFRVLAWSAALLIFDGHVENTRSAPT